MLWGIALLVSSLLLPVVGWALDVLGVRVVVAVATTGFSLALWGLGTIQTDAKTIFEFGQTSFSLSAKLCVLLATMRFCGPECLVLAATTTTNRWWVRHRGRAMAVVNFFGNIILLFPALTFSLMSRIGGSRTDGHIGHTFAQWTDDNGATCDDYVAFGSYQVLNLES